VQTRYSIREVGPRVVLGFVAANLSLVVAEYAIGLANAATAAVLGDGADPQTSGRAITELFVGLVAGSLVSGGLFAGALSLVLAVLLVALLVGYVVRVALTVILLAGAPLALMWHGLPHTEGVAHWFWRAGAGVLGIQVGQSLALICAVKVFLRPGGFHFFGMPTADGVVNLIVLIALVWILVKIPGWVMRQVRVGGGHRSFVGGMAHALVVGRVMGVLAGRGAAARVPAAGGGGARVPRGRDPGWPAPVREWGGVDGPMTVEAIGRRLHAQRAREVARRHTVSGRQRLPFLQPSPQVPTHDLAHWDPAGSTTVPEFRSAVPDDAAAGPAAHPVGDAAPVFRVAGQGARSGSAHPPRRGMTPVSPEPLFRPATEDAVVRPVRASTRVQAPVFASAVPRTGAHGRRARTHTPAPVLFRPPAPPGLSAPRPPAPPGPSAASAGRDAAGLPEGGQR
jgi:hypothetical protein